MSIKNTYKFRPNIDIGSLDAENDKLLINAFVEKNEFQLLKEFENNKCIVLGRTGSGKSALLKYLETSNSNIKRIDPQSMSLRHLSNSTIINYFKSYEVNLDLLFKVLWRHVFIVEIIKLIYGTDIPKSKRYLEWIKEKAKNDKSRKIAIDYLAKWEDHFWEHTEHRIKEIEKKVESNYYKAIEGEDEIFKLQNDEIKEHPQYGRIKEVIKYKAEKVINESQVEALKGILDILKEDILKKSQKKYYIIIDDLDKEWVANTIVYDLIKALFETIKEFTAMPNLKIIIALRSNIHKKIFKENVSRGIQREKYNDMYLDIIWSREELELLINNRLRELMRAQYTNETPKIEDILPDESKREKSGFDYILDRTFNRPRDIIDFFNKCFKYANGKTKISREIIKQAEVDYSVERLNALEDEWLENYGKMDVIFSFLKGCKNGFSLIDIKTKAEESFLEQLTTDKVKLLTNKELKCFFDNFAKNLEVMPLLKKILHLLFDVGIIGIKITPQDSIQFASNSHNVFNIDEINEETKFYVHKMFVRALKIIQIDN
ncbi:MAG: hypothetical protein KA792_00995 [Bacteroidales bacterium]|nr:hypothetical protein [Bacteroidales bacterium]